MTTQTLPSKTDTSQRENMVHLVWNHSSNLALCGAKTKGAFTEDAPECVVCWELRESIRKALEKALRL